MAELVDALDSKSGYRKVVQVRFLFWAPKTMIISDLSWFYNFKKTLFPAFFRLFTFHFSRKGPTEFPTVWIGICGMVINHFL